MTGVFYKVEGERPRLVKPPVQATKQGVRMASVISYVIWIIMNHYSMLSGRRLVGCGLPNSMLSGRRLVGCGLPNSMLSGRRLVGCRLWSTKYHVVGSKACRLWSTKQHVVGSKACRL